MRLLHIASGNAHKVAEVRAVLAHPALTVVGAPPGFAVDEDAPDFVGNAAKKARALFALCQMRGEAAPWVLADDSGLEVDALMGRPGVRSARFGQDEAARRGQPPPGEQDAGCRQALLDALSELGAVPRTARLRCTLALLSGTPTQLHVFDGVVAGTIAHTARGTAGFGYDPLFIPEHYDQTFGELGAAIKAQLSHRGRALAKLQAAWPTLP